MQIQSGPYHYACWIFDRSEIKSAIFQDYVHECDADLIAVTETWLKEIDDAVRAEVKPTGYKLADVPPPDRRGGGTALFYRESINVFKHNAEVKTTFEFSEWKVILPSDINLRLIIVYRAPYSEDHKVTSSTFLKNSPITWILLSCVMNASYHWRF